MLRSMMIDTTFDDLIAYTKVLAMSYEISNTSIKNLCTIDVVDIM